MSQFSSVQLFRQALQHDVQLMADEREIILKAAEGEGDPRYVAFLEKLFEALTNKSDVYLGEAKEGMIVSFEEEEELSTLLDQLYGSPENAPEQVQQILDTVHWMKLQFYRFRESYAPRSFHLPWFIEPQSDGLQRYESLWAYNTDRTDYSPGLFRWVYSQTGDRPRALHPSHVKEIQITSSSGSATVCVKTEQVTYTLNLTGKWETSTLSLVAGDFEKIFPVTFSTPSLLGAVLLDHGQKTGNWKNILPVYEIFERMQLEHPDAEKQAGAISNNHGIVFQWWMHNYAMQIRGKQEKKEIPLTPDLSLGVFLSSHTLPSDVDLGAVVSDFPESYRRFIPGVGLVIIPDHEVENYLFSYARQHHISVDDIGFHVGAFYTARENMIVYFSKARWPYQFGTMPHEYGHREDDVLLTDVPRLYWKEDPEPRISALSQDPLRQPPFDEGLPPRGHYEYYQRGIRFLSDDRDMYGIPDHWEALKKTKSFTNFYQLADPTEYFTELLRGMRGEARVPNNFSVGPISPEEIFEKDPKGYLTASFYLETESKYAFTKMMFQEAEEFLKGHPGEDRPSLEAKWHLHAKRVMPLTLLWSMRNMERRVSLEDYEKRPKDLEWRTEYIEMASYLEKEYLSCLSEEGWALVKQRVALYQEEIRLIARHTLDAQKGKK